MAISINAVKVYKVNGDNGQILKEYELLPLLRGECTIRSFFSYLMICEYGNSILTDYALSACGFYIDGEIVRANPNFILSDFLDYHNIPNDCVYVVVREIDGGYGATGYIPPIGRFTINANEGKHLYAPHVHVLCFNDRNTEVRIRLSDLSPMSKEDKCLFRKFYKAKDRKTILNIIRENKKMFECCYYKITRGEDVKGLFEIHYEDKTYVIK